MYSVFYDAFDKDRVLFVKLLADATKNDVVVFTGTQKECRLYKLSRR